MIKLYLFLALVQFVLCRMENEVPLIRVESSSITPGLTKFLNIGCSMANGSVPTMTSLFSLVLLHSKRQDEPNFVEIVSISISEGLNKYADTPQLAASGIVNNRGTSFVNVTLGNPRQDNAGVYKCEAHGINNKGRPVSVSSTAAVQATPPNLDIAIDEIRKLRDGLEYIQNKLKISKNGYFIESPEFNGKRYLLTRAATFYYTGFAEATCGLHGGYLAEIDTQAEFEFVRHFVKKHGSHFKYVMTGGTNEGHGDIWINRYSKTPVASFWYPGEPNNGRGMCQCFTNHEDWYMNDAPCLYSNDDSVGFICEVLEI